MKTQYHMHMVHIMEEEERIKLETKFMQLNLVTLGRWYGYCKTEECFTMYPGLKILDKVIYERD